MCLGCPEVPSNIPVTYTLPDCPEGSPCEEYSYTECIKYEGPNLVSLGITHGMSLKDALAGLNYILTTSFPTASYTITVATGQSHTTVEYINDSGEAATVTVTTAQSPVTICAQSGSAVKVSGTGTLSEPGASC